MTELTAPPEPPPLFLRIVRFPLTRLVLSLIVLAAITVPAMLFIHRPGMGAAHVPSAWAMIVQEVVPAVAALVAILLVGIFVEDASRAQLGFGRGALVQTTSGFVAGASLLTLVVGVLGIAGWYHPIAAGAQGHATLYDFTGEVILFLFVALAEELVFRGILFRLIEQLFGTWVSLAFTAVLFGWVHHKNPGATWASTVGIAVEAGVLLAATYVVTRNFWVAIGMHWAWNLFEGPVWGTPVSGIDLKPLVHAQVQGPVLWTGGAFGPEAGVVCMIAGGTLGAILMGIAIRRGNVFTPRWMRRLFGMAWADAPVAPLPAPQANA